MKRIMLLCTIISALFLSGCIEKFDIKREFEDTAPVCIENEEDSILELYSYFNTGVIKAITVIFDKDKSEGELIEYNGRLYDVVPPDTAKEQDKERYHRAAEIYDQLYLEYSIADIRYYDDSKKMELWYSKSALDFDCAIVYYPPDSPPPEDIYNKEKYIEIKDGFYMLFYTHGF